MTYRKLGWISEDALRGTDTLHPLTKEQKLFNRELLQERIVIENINARAKTFKIMSERYRNRRKRHLLRMNLVCAILNRELVL